MNRNKRRGGTLVETTFVAMFTVIIVAGAMLMTIGVGKSFNRTSAQHQVDQGASQAIQRITRDLQEAKDFQIITSSRIRIFYPVSAGGTYNRRITDTVNTIEYYRGNENGSVNPNGNFLVRNVAGAARPVAEGVEFLEFSSDSPSSVIVDTRFEQTVNDHTFDCSMTHRAILMRNYSQ